jgi:ABC-type antimicrobial peptide transport system permease subunit
MEDLLARSVADRRFNLLVIGAFAGVALVLAGIGLYGIMAYTVRMRTREIGVRMALGARRRDVTRLIVTQAGRLMALGLAIGLAGAVASSRLLDGLLFGITATDASTFAGVCTFLLALGLAAAFIPARRAARIDPLHALRE